jgi:hypothetical protein
MHAALEPRAIPGGAVEPDRRAAERDVGEAFDR